MNLCSEDGRCGRSRNRKKRGRNVHLSRTRVCELFVLKRQVVIDGRLDFVMEKLHFLFMAKAVFSRSASVLYKFSRNASSCCQCEQGFTVPKVGWS